MDAGDPRVQAAARLSTEYTYYEFVGPSGNKLVLCPELNMLILWSEMANTGKVTAALVVDVVTALSGYASLTSLQQPVGLDGYFYIIQAEHLLRFGELHYPT